MKRSKQENDVLLFDCCFELLMQLAKGNSALALAMTVISNLLGILIVSCIVSTVKEIYFLFGKIQIIA